MRQVSKLAIAACFASLAWSADSDALAIEAVIQARHLPHGTILDPIFASSTSTQIVGYTRCGDSALWTGAYLAAEAYRYKITQSSDALNNARSALAAIKGLVDVTGDNRLARCMVPANSPWAAGIANEEAANTVHQSPPYIWVDNTSRDQVVGVFFGLGAAFDLVDDASMKSTIGDIATRMTGFISRHQWSPNDDTSNSFTLRPEELQMLLQVTRHVNPAAGVSGPTFVLPVDTGVTFDVLGLGSYFKFNLDFMTFYNLVRIQNNTDNRQAYQTARNFTSSHQNAFFDMVDRALNGPDASRDAEVRSLLNQWLQRPRRDFSVDNSKSVPVCGSEACQPVPVPQRPPTDFLWQRDPFQLAGGGSGLIESAGVDYILPYWMARYYGVLSATNDVQSAAAAISVVAPGSLASIYGSSLAASNASATVQPLPTSLGGATVAVTDAAGVQRSAGLIFVSPAQINFAIPDGTAPGAATVSVGSQAFSAIVQAVAPALFTMNGAGTGVAAATAIRTQAANPQIQAAVPVFQCLLSPACTSVPIALGVDTPVYVTFYGTGIRNRSSLANVSVAINGVNAPVSYAGPAPGFTGLDQVNVLLPLTLRGAGESNVVLTVDGQTSNTATINIQ